MIESASTRYPSDMMRASHERPANTIEGTARHLLSMAEQYARDQPTTAMLCAFGIGFVLGWKLKPW
jgi:hypothetical protein